MQSQIFAGLEAQLAELASMQPTWSVLLEGQGDRWYAQIDREPGSGEHRHGASASTPTEAVRRAHVLANAGVAG